MELPHAIEGAKALLQKDGITDSCAAVAGNFLEAVPAGGDAYLMKRVIHDWDDQRACQILKNCYNQMNRSGRLLVIERVIADGDDPDRNKFIDLEMLMLNAGGRERTEADFKELYGNTGFDLKQVIRTASAYCIIEGVKT